MTSRACLPNRILGFGYFDDLKQSRFRLHGDFELKALPALNIGSAELGGDENGDGGAVVAVVDKYAEKPSFTGTPVVESFFHHAFDPVSVATQSIGVFEILPDVEITGASKITIRPAAAHQGISAISKNSDEGKNADKMSWFEG